MKRTKKKVGEKKKQKETVKRVCKQTINKHRTSNWSVHIRSHTPRTASADSERRLDSYSFFVSHCIVVAAVEHYNCRLFCRVSHSMPCSLCWCFFFFFLFINCILDLTKESEKRIRMHLFARCFIYTLKLGHLCRICWSIDDLFSALYGF